MTIFKAALLFPSKFSLPKNTRRAPSRPSSPSHPSPRSPLTASVARRQFFIHPSPSTRGSRALRTCANAPPPALSPSLAAIRVSPRIYTDASSSLFDSTPHFPPFSRPHIWVNFQPEFLSVGFHLYLSDFSCRIGRREQARCRTASVSSPSSPLPLLPPSSSPSGLMSSYCPWTYITRHTTWHQL